MDISVLITIAAILLPFVANAKIAKDKGRNVKSWLLATVFLSWLATVVLVFLPPKDTAPPDNQEETTPDLAGINLNLFITYQDSGGSVSERQIKAHKTDGSRYLYAHCLLKNGPRTFRIDRIQSCTDVDSGEVIKNIPLYFKNKYTDA